MSRARNACRRMSGLYAFLRCYLAHATATVAAHVIEALPPPLLQGSASVARRNPILCAPAGGPASWSRGAATAAARRATSWCAGLSGRPPKSPPRSIRGLGSSCRCHCCSTAVAAVTTVAARRRRAPQGMIPPAPPAAAFSLPSAGATRARPLPPSPDSRWSAPSRRAAAGLAQAQAPGVRRHPHTHTHGRGRAKRTVTITPNSEVMLMPMRSWGRPPAPRAHE